MEETASSSRNPWVLAAWLLILSIAILAAAHWPAFPYFLDSYYHLAVIQGFKAAGGPVLHAFWEAAPEGRPHLYPPLFHLFFLHGSLLGLHPITLARFWSWACHPFLLLTTWVVLSRITSTRLACLSLITLCTPYSFFLSCVNYLPATLTLAAFLGVMLAVHRHRWLAGGLLLACTFWLHAGMPWLLAFSLLLFSGLEPTYRKTCWQILLVALVGASPWLFHLARNSSLIQLHARGEDSFLDLPIFLFLLGLVGLPIAWRRRGIGRFPVVLAAGFIPMLLAGYRFRFFSTQGLFPWLLLAAVTLEWAVQRIRRPWAVGLLLAGLALFSPTLHGAPGEGKHLAWADTTFSILPGFRTPLNRATGNPTYHERFMSELAEVVRSHTGPDELIYANLDYLGGMMSALTGRATTNQMLREMVDRSPQGKIPPAKLILWAKDPSGRRPAQMEEMVLQYHLRPLSETELAYFFINLWPTGHRQVSRAVVPWWVGSLLLATAAGFILWDLKRPSPLA